MSMPSDSEFLRRADQCLTSVQAALDSFDPDELEADLAGGVLRISFPDKRNCILNRQSAASQIWLAEGASAWHFVFESARGVWTDTKGRGELRAILEGVIARRVGRAVQIAIS